MMYSGLGPSLEELASGAKTSASNLGSVFLARGFGILVGSACAGKALDSYLSRSHAVLGTGLLGLGAATGLLSLIPSNTGIHCLLVVQGVFAGCVNVCCSTLLAWVHGSGVAPWMQAMNVAFGVGALIAPILIGISLDTQDTRHATRLGRTYWAFWGISIVIACAGGLLKSPLPTMWQLPSQKNAVVPDDSVLVCEDEVDFLVESLETRIEEKLGDQRLDQTQEPNGIGVPASPQAALATPNTLGFAAAVSLGMILFAYVGAEDGFGGWLFEYVLGRKLGGHKMASFYVSAYWGSLSVGRAVAVFVIPLTSNKAVLLGSSVLALGPLIGILLVPSSKAGLWIFTVAFGLLMAPTLPSVLSLPNEMGFTMTGRSTAIIVLLANAGDMVIPTIVGALFKYSTLWMPRVCVASMACMCAMLVAAVRMLRHHHDDTAAARLLPPK